MRRRNEKINNEQTRTKEIFWNSPLLSPLLFATLQKRRTWDTAVRNKLPLEGEKVQHLNPIHEI